MAERWTARSDRGAVLVLATLLLTGLMVMAAIVVDIGHMRNMRRSNQTVVDFAALAAGDELAAVGGPDAPASCEDAVRYLRLNADALSSLTLDCSPLPTICGPTTASKTVSASTSTYDVEITYPVGNAAIFDPTVGGAGLRHDDGEQCDRLMVSVEQRADSYFGGVVGVDELRTGATAVVRQIPEKERRIPSLWLLDPHGCNVLTVQGGSQVRVGKPDFGGLISLDSDGTGCSGNSYTVDVGGAGSLVEAFPTNADPPGQISLVAMEPGQVGCADGNLYACDPADISNGTLTPQPVRRLEPATRGPIDHRFNCRAGEDAYPDYHGIDIADCDGGTAPYIDQLRAGVGEKNGPSDPNVPTGFQTWTYGCNNPTGMPAGGLDGNWYIDCNTFKLTGTTQVTFNGGNVIFEGGISLSGGAIRFNDDNDDANLPSQCLDQITTALCLGASSEEAAWVYMRNGDISMTGGTLYANKTMIYQHDGVFKIAGGSPPIWSAPTEGPFTSLAVWAEKPGSYQINGGASMELTGIFFTPEAAPFTLNGGAPLIPQQAQFISFNAAISGGANLTLSPLEIQPVVIPPPAPLLIR